MPKVKKSRFLCSQCGKPTKVLRTRSALPQKVIRYRVCDDGHRFSTKEIMDDVPNSPAGAIATSNLRFALREMLENLGINEDLPSTSNTKQDN
ncbi:hypothetical protein Mal48_33460 [Thalassoglobus polymorphus]|uniref:Uncharacterized protein n=1 Tax=Thalassoglobus polymorphus TaxID=2527994 RepID=A0A517QR24_9PLAN|nr:hypothetical protein Mal48_33460 [Thalassoglobus polymorphus]